MKIHSLHVGEEVVYNILGEGCDVLETVMLQASDVQVFVILLVLILTHK